MSLRHDEACELVGRLVNYSGGTAPGYFNEKIPVEECGWNICPGSFLDDMTRTLRELEETNQTGKGVSARVLSWGGQGVNQLHAICMVFLRVTLSRVGQAHSVHKPTLLATLEASAARVPRMPSAVEERVSSEYAAVVTTVSRESPCFVSQEQQKGASSGTVLTFTLFGFADVGRWITELM